MKIKKYEARTEQEAIEKVKDELGLDALILNIRKNQPKGIFAFFRKPIVEVTAAYGERAPKAKVTAGNYKNEARPALDGSAGVGRSSAGSGFNNAPKENLNGISSALAEEYDYLRMDNLTGAERWAEIEKYTKKTDTAPSSGLAGGAESASKSEDDYKIVEAIVKDRKLLEQQEKIKLLEKKLSNAEDLLEKVVSQISVGKMNFNGFARKYENSMIQLFYDSLIEQGVTVEIAEKLLEDVNAVDDTEKVDINLIVKIVYNTIVSILGEPDTSITDDINPGKTKIITFMGPTGVGKTTTIAKLSSIFLLQHNLNVGLITADTYRIAAVEQLKTYAEILGLDVGIVYNKEDLEFNVSNMSYDKEIIMLDTAGRSHRNPENFNELKELLSVIPNCEKFLVLSITTKYDDLLSIVNTFSDISDFKIIFTKLDETICLGSILNICYLTGRKVSYVTNGQNVPEDIEVIQPEKIAKALLGLGGGTF